MSVKRKPNKTTPARKMEIIRAALECFNRKGFTDASMQEIRQAAKASYGSVYHHFKSKEMLAAAVYMEGVKDFQDKMIAMLNNASGARDGIVGMVYCYLDWIEANPSWAKFLLTMRHADFMGDTEALIEMRNREFVPVLGDFFTKNIHAGNLKNMPRDVCLSIILGPCQEFTRLWTQGAASTDIKETKELIGEAVWSALKA